MNNITHQQDILEIKPKDLPKTTFWLFTDKEDIWNSISYKTGLNTSKTPFCITKKGINRCNQLLFCFPYESFTNPNMYNLDKIEYVRKVTFLDDSRLCKMEMLGSCTYFCDKFFTDEKQKFYLPRKLSLNMVKENGSVLQYIENQTPELCLLAVQEDSFNFQYIKHQTEKTCLEAVKEDGWLLELVKEQTPEICMAAVKSKGEAIEFVKEQTHEICLAAVKQNGCALEFVEEQTHDICLAAVKQNGCALEFVEEQTEDICIAALACLESEDEKEHIIDCIPEEFKYLLVEN